MGSSCGTVCVLVISEKMISRGLQGLDVTFGVAEGSRELGMALCTVPAS